jgi:hypothetical protein
MKHPWLYLLWLYPFVMLGQEATTKATCYLKIKIENETTTYYFDQIADLEEHCEEIVSDVIIPKKKKQKGTSSMPEIEVSITYNNKTASKKVSTNITLFMETLQKLKIQLQIPHKE